MPAAARQGQRILIALPKPLLWLGSAALTVLIVALSIVPGVPKPGDSAFVWAVAKTPGALQNAMHVVVYAALVVSWYLTLANRRRGFKLLTAIAAAAIIFGAILEYVQLSVPGRFGSLFDAGLNTAGVVVGAIVITTVVMPRNQR